MATTISLQKVFGSSTTYVSDHQTNYTAIETAINSLYTSVQGTATSGAADQRVGELYDTRNGIFGKASYKPVAATLTATAYNLTVAAGAYWSGVQYRSSSVAALISLVSFSTATLYVNVPTGGIPTVTTTAGIDTVWQFAWDATTKIVSAVAFYSATAEYLLDGDDYADSIAGYDGLAARLAALGSASTFLPQQYAERSAAHSGLNFGYYGGQVHNDNVVTTTADGTVLTTNAVLNYLEVNISTAAVTANTTGFTAGRIPLFTVTPAGSVIASVVDKRTWARGGGAGSHAQNTDVGTDSAEFKLLRTVTGAPSSNGSFKVERGTSADVDLRWNETTDEWQFTNDGTTYTAIGSGGGTSLGSQELSKYKALADPTLVLTQTAVSTDGAYVKVDLGPTGTNVIADAPQGVQALVLRVAFWDTTPGAGVNIKFQKYNDFSAPTKSYTIYGGVAEHSAVMTLIVPGDDGAASPTIGFEKKITASAASTANVRVYLLGYYIKVTGVGTQTKDKSWTGNAVLAGATTQFNKTSFVNRGLIYTIKLTETGGTTTGLYDVNIYSKNTFLAADLLYSAVGIDSTLNSRVYTDRLPWMYLDNDSTSQLHIKITNSSAQNGTWTIQLIAEQFL